MKNYLLYIAGGMLLIAACSKDKGNYDYIEVPKPVVTAIDTAYTATVGDSLIIIPEVLLKTGKNDYSCFWKIDVPEKAMSMDYEGQALRIVFGLGANRYNALLKVRDNNNGQVYFYKFVIKGQTAFTRGVLVLSNDANKTVLTFIKPDGTVQPDIYNNINKEVLPGGAMQLVPVRNQFYTNQLSNYWITYSGGGSGAVQLDANTLQRTKYLAENFYTAPSVMKVTGFLNMMNGVTTGIINGKMYIGTTETAPFWPYYGFWGVPVDGSYNLHPNVLHNLYERPYDGYFLGFEDTKKQFLGFTTNTFLDTIYNATSGAFNPKDLKMDLVYMNRFTDNEIYAFFDSVGKKIELKFGVDFSADKRVFTPAYKRVFPGASFLTADTKWQSSPIGVFFFTSNDKIYRYNPVNNEVKALDANFNGKKVMMIKVLNGGNLLVAGVEGSIYYLDISVGQNGANPQKIDGIPGAPADIYIREN